MALPRTFSGNRARFKIRGQKVAYAGGISGEENIDLEPVDVLDMVEVFELVPVAYRCSMQTNLFRVVGASVKAIGIYPKYTNILTTGDMDASVEDSRSVPIRTAYHFQGVKASTKSFDTNARGIATEAVGFQAIRITDESGG